jgi:hypothetical protein
MRCCVRGKVHEALSLGPIRSHGAYPGALHSKPEPKNRAENREDTINHLIFGYYKIQPFLSDIYVTESTLLSNTFRLYFSDMR